MTEGVARRDPVEQLAEEFMARLRRGERPTVSEYAVAHPDLADEIRDLFPALVVMEEAKPAGTEPHAPDTGSDIPPEQLGDYRILREVARGGMGVVYEAVQESLGRHVALKVLPVQSGGDPLRLLRFRREARSAARLHHTNIVPVFDVGCAGGVHYYAMQFIQGQGLDEVLNELRRLRSGARPTDTPDSDLTASLADGLRTGLFPAAPIVPVPRPAGPPPDPSGILTGPVSHYFRSVAGLGVQAADALAYAHAQRVLHRDVKPANLLLDRQGTLWLTDFGLAKDDGEDLTRTGDVVGTLRYMAPERFQGVSDPRTDVYALGVTLYELLTLRPAFPAPDRVLLVRQIAAEEPPRPRAIDPTIPRDLETVVLKAIEKEPARRYPTAAELADDLRRFLADRPIRARRASWREQAWRWCRRNPAVALSLSTAAGFLLLLVAGLSVSTVLVWRAKQDAETALGQERLTAYYQRIALAERELAANDLARANALLDECPPDLQGWEWHYLKRLRGKTVPPLRHDHPLARSGSSVAVHPDGRWVATAGLYGTISVWDLTTGKPLRPPVQAHRRGCENVVVSPDGRRLVSSDFQPDGKGQGEVAVWDTETWACHRWPLPRGYARAIALSPDGTRMVCSTYQDDIWSEVGVRDTATGELRVTLPAHDGAVQGVAFSPDGRLVALASSDRTVHVHDAATGQVVHAYRNDFPFRSVAFSGDGRLLAAGYGELGKRGAGGVRVWEVESGRERWHFTGPGTYAVAFSPDGKRLAGGGEMTVRVWDIEAGREAITLRGHTDFVWSVAFTRDGHRLVSGSEDRTARVWDGRPLAEGENTSEELLTLTGHTEGLSAVAYSPDGRFVATGSLDGTVRLWDAATGRREWITPTGFGEVNCMVFLPGGRRLVVAGVPGGDLLVLDAATGEPIDKISGAANAETITSLAVSGDGRLLAYGDERGNVVLRNLTDKSDKSTVRLDGHQLTVAGLAFSPDPGGRLLASGSADGTVRVWDVAAGREKKVLPHPGAGGVAFSPDGTELLTGGWDRVVRVWSTADWERIDHWPDPTGAVQGVAFSPDGRLVAWGSSDSTVKVWDRRRGEVATLRGHLHWTQQVAFSPDGKRIASASYDGTAKVWETPNSRP